MRHKWRNLVVLPNRWIWAFRPTHLAGLRTKEVERKCWRTVRIYIMVPSLTTCSPLYVPNSFEVFHWVVTPFLRTILGPVPCLSAWPHPAVDVMNASVPARRRRKTIRTSGLLCWSLRSLLALNGESLAVGWILPQGTQNLKHLYIGCQIHQPEVRHLNNMFDNLYSVAVLRYDHLSGWDVRKLKTHKVLHKEG